MGHPGICPPGHLPCGGFAIQAEAAAPQRLKEPSRWSGLGAVEVAGDGSFAALRMTTQRIQDDKPKETGMTN